MNPLFGKGMPRLNPMQRISQVMNDVQRLQQNPTQLGQYLSDHGMISKEQVSEISNMNPSQVGQYLMQKGVMKQSDVQNAYQNMVPTIQNKL